MQLKIARKIHRVVLGGVSVQYHQHVPGRRRRGRIPADGERKGTLDIGFFPALRFVVEVIQDDVGGAAQYIGDRTVHATLEQPQVCLLPSLLVHVEIDFRHGERNSVVAYVSFSIARVPGSSSSMMVEQTGTNYVRNVVREKML